MAMRGPHRGAQLPYNLISGVVPCPAGWLAAPAKVQGSTMAPEAPLLLPTLLEVLDYKPAFQVVALFAPIGLLDKAATGGRTCDRDARRLLGRPRSAAVSSAPPRPVLTCSSYAEAREASGGRLSPIRWRQFARFAEVDGAIAPYWQRTVFEVHPELSFLQLNEDRPVRYSKHTRAGREEREQLLRARIPGVERIVEAEVRRVTASQLLDAAACLWTARRILARAITRIPQDPEWDSVGLRMEILR
jgi:predicted RNase H-like nuclease